MTGSGVTFGATKKPFRCQRITRATEGSLMVGAAMSCAVSPAPRMTTVLPFSQAVFGSELEESEELDGRGRGRGRNLLRGPGWFLNVEM